MCVYIDIYTCVCEFLRERACVCVYVLKDNPYYVIHVFKYSCLILVIYTQLYSFNELVYCPSG